MARLILWSLLALVAWQWWRGALRPPSSSPPAARTRAQNGAGSPLMRPCAHCGVHLAPEVQLPGRGGAVYCCNAHREAHEPPARA